MTRTPDPKDPAAERARPKNARAEVFLIVTGPERGRRRAGHTFGPTAVELPIADLTDEDLAAIKGDPLLTVSTETRAGEARE